MSVTTDPRLRARKVEVQRAAGRRRLEILLAGLLAVALVIGMLVVLHSSLFGAKVVHILGATHESRAELIEAAGLAGAPPLIDVSIAKAEAGIDRLAWVASSRVAKAWPTGVDITVVERRPAAVVALGAGRFALVDRTGRVLADEKGPLSGLVALRGVATRGAPGSDLASSARPLLAVASALPASVAARVASVATSSGGGVVARLRSGPLVRFGPADALQAKVVALETLLAKVNLTGIALIDVRVPSEPVLTR